MKDALFGKTESELKEIALELGLPKYTGRQMAQWLYHKDVTDLSQMTNVSKKARAALAEHYVVGRTAPRKVTVSSDGTKKYLYGTGVPTDAPAGEPGAVTAASTGAPAEVSAEASAGHAPDAAQGAAAPAAGEDGGQAGGAARDPLSDFRYVEAAYIPETDRATLCLSTQVGCKMGCLFCMTGKQGFQGQLTAGEIVNQLASLPERESVTNIVYMGMGEPLDNVEAVLKSLEILTSDWGYGMSPRRITVSTIGVIPGMRAFLDNSNAHLAVSVHSPFDEERRQLMPVQHVYPLSQVLDLVRSYELSKSRRISFEYIVFGGLNHSQAHVKELSRLLHGIRARVNLIHFHSIPDTPLKPASEEQMLDFQKRLQDKGIPTTIRRSRGQDVQAACGMLSTKELLGQGQEDF
jgi:23S rRNA (adenine2503-C2)-methyltransferase